MLEIVALCSHALEREPQTDGDGFGCNIAKDGALGDARSEEPESDKQIDRVGGKESIAQESEEEGIARGCLLCASASLRDMTSAFNREETWSAHNTAVTTWAVCSHSTYHVCVVRPSCAVKRSGTERGGGEGEKLKEVLQGEWNGVGLDSAL